MNIVLTHGILGFRNISIINYFNGVKEHLEAAFAGLPIRVLVTEVDPIRGVKVRGASLAAQIIAALEDGRLDDGAKTHIIAHSMGGLDSRYILSPANPDNISSRISSLTTVCTPHQGSPVADLLFLKFDEEAATPFRRQMEKKLRNVIEEAGISLQGLEDLTKSATDSFNAGFPDHEAVHYFSIAGQGREGFFKTCKVLLLSHLFIEVETGEKNDGLVTLSSASRAGSETILWPVDHADAIGHDLDHGLLSEPTHFNHREGYSDIVKKISQI